MRKGLTANTFNAKTRSRKKSAEKTFFVKLLRIFVALAKKKDDSKTLHLCIFATLR
jgi:hypothetical protein